MKPIALALNGGMLKSGIPATGTVSEQDVTMASVKAFTRKHCKTAGKMRALNDTEMRALPEKLSMFRLMVALHEIIDFPREMLMMPRAGGDSSAVGGRGEGDEAKAEVDAGAEKKTAFFVSFSVLGFEFAAEILLDEARAAFRAEKEEKERSAASSEQDYATDFSDSQGTKASVSSSKSRGPGGSSTVRSRSRASKTSERGKGKNKEPEQPPLPSIPVKKMRVFHFMVPTAAEEVLVKSFLERQSEISILCTQRDSTKKLKRVGNASLPVRNFKNPHMKKIDLFAVFGLDLGKALVRATVGLERMEQNMSTAAIARATKLYDFGSLVVPEQTYFTPKSLPIEWIESLGVKAAAANEEATATAATTAAAAAAAAAAASEISLHGTEGGEGKEGTRETAQGMEIASPVPIVSRSRSSSPLSPHRGRSRATPASTSSPTTQMTVWSVRVDMSVGCAVIVNANPTRAHLTPYIHTFLPIYQPPSSQQRQRIQYADKYGGDIRAGGAHVRRFV